MSIGRAKLHKVEKYACERTEKGALFPRMNHPTHLSPPDPERIRTAHVAAGRPAPSERDLFIAARACGRDVTQERANEGRAHR